jgi:predicted transcriptional regulator
MKREEKITRSIRLSPDITERLQAVSAHLGVNVNAYIVAEIGRAVARDEVTLRAETDRGVLFKQVEEMMRKEALRHS